MSTEHLATSLTQLKTSIFKQIDEFFETIKTPFAVSPVAPAVDYTAEEPLNLALLRGKSEATSQEICPIDLTKDTALDVDVIVLEDGEVPKSPSLKVDLKASENSETTVEVIEDTPSPPTKHKKTRMSTESSTTTRRSRSHSRGRTTTDAPRRRQPRDLESKFKISAIKCTQCPEWFLDQASAEQHLEQVHQLHPYQCPAEHCGRSYRIRDDLNDHCRRVHYAIRVWPCRLCSRVFRFGGGLRLHRHLAHTEGSFDCLCCSFKAKYRADILNHTDRMHGPGEKRKRR